MLETCLDEGLGIWVTIRVDFVLAIIWFSLCMCVCVCVCVLIILFLTGGDSLYLLIPFMVVLL